jgi:hypothetical protein
MKARLSRKNRVLLESSVGVPSGEPHGMHRPFLHLEKMALAYSQIPLNNGSSLRTASMAAEKRDIVGAKHPAIRADFVDRAVEVAGSYSP